MVSDPRGPPSEIAETRLYIRRRRPKVNNQRRKVDSSNNYNPVTIALYEVPRTAIDNPYGLLECFLPELNTKLTLLKRLILEQQRARFVVDSLRETRGLVPAPHPPSMGRRLVHALV